MIVHQTVSHEPSRHAVATHKLSWPNSSSSCSSSWPRSPSLGRVQQRPLATACGVTSARATARAGPRHSRVLWHFMSDSTSWKLAAREWLGVVDCSQQRPGAYRSGRHRRGSSTQKPIELYMYAGLATPTRKRCLKRANNGCRKCRNNRAQIYTMLTNEIIS